MLYFLKLFVPIDIRVSNKSFNIEKNRVEILRVIENIIHKNNTTYVDNIEEKEEENNDLISDDKIKKE